MKELMIDLTFWTCALFHAGNPWPCVEIGIPKETLAATSALVPPVIQGVPADWCQASIATDYGQTPPKEIVTNPAGWCWTGDMVGVPTAGGYTAQ
jgi:hypothetical protein